MQKNIDAAIIGHDEAKALGGIEPLHMAGDMQEGGLIVSHVWIRRPINHT